MSTTTTTTTNLPHHIKPNQASPETKEPIVNISQKKILEILNTKCTTSLQNLKQAHGVVLRSGHFQDHYVAGTLLKCYASPSFNNFGIALKVFGDVWKPNVFVWNTMIKGCVENHEALKAVAFYCDMVDMNSRPNKFTYPMLFKACRLAQAVEEALQIHAHVVKQQQFSEDGHIRSAGIQMYASFGLVEDARKMLMEGAASLCDVVCWNAMLDGYMKCGDVDAAQELFDEHMPSKNVGSWNVMVSGLARRGRLEEARRLFDLMAERDEVSWSAMIDGYVQGGCHKEALEVFNEMQREKIVRPSRYVLPSVLAACANVGALDQGKWVHGYVKKNSVQVDAVLGTALVDLYAKCGRLDMAWEVFENVKRKEVSMWNAMIGALAMHGRADDALDIFFKMQGDLKPNGITFINALNACAHGGFVDEGLTIFSSMDEMYGLEAQVEHYACVVDMLGRAGLLEEAEQVINIMLIEPNASVYGALLGACRKHRNVEMGERVGKILLEIEPQNGGRYALLSNIYAEAGMWDDAANVRKLMKERGVKTNVGISMVDIGGNVHEFKMGEGSHPQMKEVYLMLEKIIEKLKTEGYTPRTSQVLFDIADEEEKETAVTHHSEKLAVAFGVLNTKPGATIRVVKNLRMCEDCHCAIKMFSQLDKRDIIVRDRMRYHHFRNGTCSCNDFW